MRRIETYTDFFLHIREKTVFIFCICTLFDIVYLSEIKYINFYIILIFIFNFTVSFKKFSKTKLLVYLVYLNLYFFNWIYLYIYKRILKDIKTKTYINEKRKNFKLKVNNFNHFKSCHPYSVYHNTLRNHMFRIKRLCSSHLAIKMLNNYFLCYASGFKNIIVYSLI